MTKKISPTQRSLEKLRDAGYLAEVVERWLTFAKCRKDLWGFVDILAIRDGEILGVQATSYTNISARVKKITEHENTPIIRKAGIKIQVWGFRKKGRFWECKVVDLS